MLNLTGDDIDVKTIDRLLRANVVALVIELRGQQPSRRGSSSAELRFGRKGSLAVVIAGEDIGRITDFEADGKGMPPLKFIQRERGLTFPETLRWARDWLERNAAPDPEPPPASPAAANVHGGDSKQKLAKVLLIAGEMVPIAGTPAEAYLRKRGIVAAPPACIGYRANAFDGYGALVVQATDASGTLRAVQQIYVTADGIKAPLDVQKRTNGPLKGAAVKLPGIARGPLILAEGPETAWSVWQACSGVEVWAVLGSGNFLAVVEAHRQQLASFDEVIIAADGDVHGSDAERSLKKQLAAMVALGLKVRIARPPEILVVENGVSRVLEKPDFNDLLRHTNEHTVVAAICAAQPVAALPVHYPDAPEEREVALADMRATITAFLEGELRRLQAKREVKMEIARRYAEAGLDLTEFQVAFLPREERRRITARKAAIARAVNRENKAKYGAIGPGRRLQVPAPAGAGKTKAVAEVIVLLPGLAEFVIHYAVPDLFIADEVAATFRALAEKHGIKLNVRVVRGMGAPLPGAAADADGSVTRMCGRWETAKAVIAAGLRVGTNLCKSETKVCPLYDTCAYQAQRQATGGGVYIIAHDLLVLTPVAPPADLLIVDEAHHKKLLGSLSLPLDRLVSVGEKTWNGRTAGAAADYLAGAKRIEEALLAEVRDAARERRAPQLLAAVRRIGIADSKALDVVRVYLARIDDEVKPVFDPSWDERDILSALREYRASEIGHVKRVYRALADEIDKSRGFANGISLDPDRAIEINGKPAHAAMLEVYYRKRVRFGGDVAALLLDASADLGINRRIWGERLENAPARIPRNAQVVQVIGKGFSRQSITGCYRNGQPISEVRLAAAQRLQDELVDWLNALPGSVAVIMNKPVRKLIAPRLRPGIKIGHFGALRGRNEWKDCDIVVVIGRDQPPPSAVESDARALYADDEAPLVLTGRYDPEERRLRMSGDGPPVTSMVMTHTDRRVQALLESYREREVEQGIDRGRLIHNAEPKRVYILNDLVLDITVDEVTSWKELRQGGSRYERAWAATGILPTGAADLHRAHPNLWATVKAAERALEKYPPNPNNTHCLEVGGIYCSYRRQGQRGKASTVFLCRSRHPDSRAALEALLGPLTEFAVILECHLWPRWDR
jgi:hypothetical protein